VLIFEIIKSYAFSKYCRGFILVTRIHRKSLKSYTWIAKSHQYITTINRKIQNMILENKSVGYSQTWVNEGIWSRWDEAPRWARMVQLVCCAITSTTDDVTPVMCLDGGARMDGERRTRTGGVPANGGWTRTVSTNSEESPRTPATNSSDGVGEWEREGAWGERELG
jgi:hypothetical protein